MEKLRALGESTKSLSESAKSDLKKLSEEVHKTMVQQGFATEQNCRTVCSVSVGPDGKPVVTCSLICDW